MASAGRNLPKLPTGKGLSPWVEILAYLSQCGTAMNPPRSRFLFQGLCRDAGSPSVSGELRSSSDTSEVMETPVGAGIWQQGPRGSCLWFLFSSEGKSEQMIS